MNEEWWERPAWYVNDNWWVIFIILLLGLGIYLTRIEWLPWFERPTAIQTPFSITQPRVPTSSLPNLPSPQPTSGWSHFVGQGYSLDYPSSWYAYHPSSEMRDPSGIIYDLILSDAAGNESPQFGTPDEKARVMIWLFPRPTQNLAEWVTQHWVWLDTGIESVTIGGYDGLQASLHVAGQGQQQYFWFDYRDSFFGIQSYSQTLPDLQAMLQRILDSLKWE